LENDRTIREAFYETDGDATNISFAGANLRGFFNPLPPIIPFPNGLSQSQYRDLILSEHMALNAAYPDCYKTFILSGDATHTALQSSRFYTFDADGVLLNEWTDDFLVPRQAVLGRHRRELCPAPLAGGFLCQRQQMKSVVRGHANR
jgi:hypothetical protein